MPKLKSYGILTSGEISKAEHLGTLSIADHLSCPFCDGTINTKTGEREIEQPFLQDLWGVPTAPLGDTSGSLTGSVGFQELKILQTTTQKEIKQSTGNDIQVSRQRGGTIADEILVYLDKKPIAETAELREATQSSPQGFSLAIKKLIKAGQVRKIKRGWYERITDDADVESST